MGAVTNQLGKMKVAFVVVIFSSLALAQDCPVVTPIVCGPDDMTCGGGVDANGCPIVDTCMGGATDVCPAVCPVPCPADHMHCGGGMDPNGCPMPDTCMPMTGPIGNDGNACPVACPIVCAPGTMICPGGIDHNGCQMPDTCGPASTA